jgi:hypothetical protein
MAKSAKDAAKLPKKTRSKKADDNDQYERQFIDEPEAQTPPPPKPERTIGNDIRKAKIKNEIFLEVEYSEMIKDGTNTVKKDCTAPIHNDLKAAFQKLDVHLTAIAQQYNSSGEFDFENVTCTGFSVGGNGEGVKLFGTRKLDPGGAFNFLSPFHKWDAETVEYDGRDGLRGAIAAAKAEVTKYLFEGKHQPDAQIKLEL